MRTRFIALLTAVWAVAPSCGTRGTGGEAVVFDYKADYPASDLTLADIADVEFIPIGKSDDFLMSGSSNAKAGETYVSDQFVLKKDRDQLFMFDRQGNPIRKIGNVGRGPQEYPWMQHFVGVDEKAGEVYIYGDSQKLQVYGIDGVFRRTIETKTPGFLEAMSLLNEEEIVCLNNREGGFFTISRQDGKKLRDLPISFPLPHALDPGGRMAYPNILHNKSGTTLFELRTDTIWCVSPRGELRPSVVDVTKYPSPDELYGPDNAQFMPMAENDKYIVGSILCSPWITPDVKERHYIFDKGQKQWFTLGEGGDWFGYETINGNISIPRVATTLSPGYAAWFLQPVNLLENRDKWRSPELEKILEGVAEDDNPILMLVKFK